MSNAIKYTVKGSVLVSLTSRDDFMVFSVSDTGILSNNTIYSIYTDINLQELVSLRRKCQKYLNGFTAWRAHRGEVTRVRESDSHLPRN